MIRSCKYCLSQEFLCPRCEGPVQTRSVVVMDKHGAAHSTSLILCENLECKAYGTFQQQTTYSIEVYICEFCKAKASPNNPKESNDEHRIDVH